jgi:hypothetical protein
MLRREILESNITKTPSRQLLFGDRLEMVAPGITGRTRPTKVKKQAASQKRKRDDVDVEQLEEAVAQLVRYPSAMKYQ